MGEALSAKLYDEVEEAMRDVIDPEIGVNVVDLGLVYGLGWSDEDSTLLIDMTLTTPECPLQDVITEQTSEVLDGVVDHFRINWVWSPPWSVARITEDGRDMMRALGFNI